MFYRNTKYEFKLPEPAPSDLEGGIICACSMPVHQLLRRPFRKYPYLQHRLFDPQLYLAGLGRSVAKTNVFKLASYPWFDTAQAPEFSSAEHGTQARWKKEFGKRLVESWAEAPMSDQGDVGRAAREAVRFQLDLECEAIILPAPLTHGVAPLYEAETSWLDAGLIAAKDLAPAFPVFATIAITDATLQSSPQENDLLRTIIDQVTAREVAGAYLVLLQDTEDNYSYHSSATLQSVLTLTDQIVRGARKRLIVNYLGLFGAVAMAAGAEIWSSDYYLSQRRLKLADFQDRVGLARPRYLSPPLLGDLGVETDLARIARSPLGVKLFKNTPASTRLHEALRAGKTSTPDWAYDQSNVNAARAHYIHGALSIGRFIGGTRRDQRPALVRRLLERSVRFADQLEELGVDESKTEIAHQREWLKAYERWTEDAGTD